MKLIVDISEEDFEKARHGRVGVSVMRKAITNGIPLDKIRAEIETKYGQCDICEYFENYDYEENDISEYRPTGNIADILQIIDKYKEESEDDGEICMSQMWR